MKPNHTPDCPHESNLDYSFDLERTNVLRITDKGIKLARHYSGNDKYTDTYCKFEYCPLCGTKYEE